ncbi:uncharacterized protein LOC134441401 [Engraulis encrasicolus]|uniref:uncharacterized protein LOC134441401 n=1 Tax=Engraulis encrasicolus TaxID=184585 RepID=UPI002FD68086
MMKRTLDPGPPDYRRRTIAVVTPTLSLDETALQPQRECEEAWWVAELRAKDRQLAVLLEERRMAALLRRKRDQRDAQRRSMAFAREQKALWGRLMMDGVADAVEKRSGMMANANLTPMMSSQDHGQDLPSSADQLATLKAVIASITARVLKEYDRGHTGQAEQLRPAARSGDGVAAMNKQNTTYHNAITDMMKAHRQEALRQELLEKQRVREREAEAVEAADKAGASVQSRLLRFWNLLRKANWCGNRRRRHAASQA